MVMTARFYDGCGAVALGVCNRESGSSTDNGETEAFDYR